VRAKGAAVCQVSASLPVTQKTRPDQIYIPNSFTPNGDGLNDMLLVYGYTIRNLRFMVFNQWGEKIFESNNQASGWNGTYRGKAQPSGVYMYVCQLTLLDGTTQVKKGSINLVR
jgi:gliding motility-associated-like protein